MELAFKLVLNNHTFKEINIQGITDVLIFWSGISMKQSTIEHSQSQPIFFIRLHLNQ